MGAGALLGLPINCIVDARVADLDLGLGPAAVKAQGSICISNTGVLRQQLIDEALVQSFMCVCAILDLVDLFSFERKLQKAARIAVLVKCNSALLRVLAQHWASEFHWTILTGIPT